MKDEIVVKRYAEAFLDYAKEHVGLARAIDDLKKMDNSILRESPEFVEFLESLEITYTEKCSVIDRVLNGEFSEEVKHLLKLLLERGRIDKLRDIIEYIREKLSAQPQAVLLRLTYPLDFKLIRKLETALQNKFNKKFKFYIDLDSELLGGVQIVVGNTLIDSSLRRKLEELEEKLRTVRIPNGA